MTPAIDHIAPAPLDLETFFSALVDTLSSKIKSLTPAEQKQMGIDDPNAHVSAKVIGGVDAVINVGNFFLSLELGSNANRVREDYRSTLKPGEKGYLLFIHEGAGQVKAVPVRSLEDRPMDWDSGKMAIEPVYGESVEAKRIHQDILDTIYGAVEQMRSESAIVVPVARPIPPSPKPCSGKSCVHGER